MAIIKGMLVRLTSSPYNWAGTDDHLYVGVFGTGGGREFPLDVKGFDDFEEGTDVKYWLGTVWDGAALTGAKKPWQSQTASGWNQPSYDKIDMDKVDYIYLRKQSVEKNDDAFSLTLVEVILYGDSPTKRIFRHTGEIGMAAEYGQRVWLREVEK